MFPKSVITIFTLALIVFLAGCVQAEPDSTEILRSPTSTTNPPESNSPTFTPEATETSIMEEPPAGDILRPADGMQMLYVPGGEFLMGSTDAQVETAIGWCRDFYTTCNSWFYTREAPQHLVTLEPFWIDQTEVTNDQYRICVETGICQPPEVCENGEPTYGDPLMGSHPVICVNWQQAVGYCQWSGSRLPTEAEWEFAARGPESLTFPWGDEFDGNLLNFCDVNCEFPHTDDRYDDGFVQTSPVGTFPGGSSWVGAMDMAGNAYEWVADWLGEYTAEPVANPIGPDEGDQKIIKGGSWFYHVTSFRPAARAAVAPDKQMDSLGFRCVSSESMFVSGPQTAQPPEGFLPGEAWQRPMDQAEMSYVPPGEFTMGADESDPDAVPEELPAHQVSLSGFWIDQTEITNRQYQQCVDAGVCRVSRYSSNSVYNGDDFPVVGVTQQDAGNFCVWVGGRLPTEAEWEFAARGPQGLRYPWGNDFDGTLINFCDFQCSEPWADALLDDGYRESAPVNSFPGGASWVGAVDMAGNVWEWVSDWYAPYSSDRQDNPTGPFEGRTAIIRGGCWASPAWGVRTSYRIDGGSEIVSSVRHPNIGFRCVIPE